MAEATKTIQVSGMPITLIPRIEAAAKRTNRDRSKFIVYKMTQAVIASEKKSGAGGNADGA